MARSQLLKDVVSGKVSIENILLRLKIILSDLNNESIMNWVNGELQGYNEKNEIPAYRILKGSPIGTYLINYQFQYTEASVPLETLVTSEIIDKLITLHVTDSIATVQNIVNGDNRGDYAKVIPTAYCHAISKGDLQVASMRIKIASNQLDGIISIVKTKLVGIIIELEKQFNNLDDLDISDQIEGSTSKREQVTYNIEQIIYDGSIKMGDKNKLSKSKLGHLFGGRKE